MAVIWHVIMSLDGFIAGPGDEMRWILEYRDANPEIDEMVSSIGAILSGRHSYDIGARASDPVLQKPYGGAWSGPIFVLTHKPMTSKDPSLLFFSADIARAVATAQRAAKGKNVLIIGAAIARQCVEHQLLDELYVQVAPVLLGDGVRLYNHPAGRAVKLEPITLSQPGQVTNMRFRFLKTAGSSDPA